MKARLTAYLCVILLISVAGGTIACSKAPNDAQISSQLQDKFNTDSGLQGKQLGVQAANGIITLSGSVDNDAQREAAARYASGMPGVKQVVNNLQVGPPPSLAPAAAAPEPEPTPAEPQKPVAARRREPAPKKRNVVAHDTTTEMASAGTGAGAGMTHQDSQQSIAPAAPVPPPPPPPPQKVTIPAGTTLAIRLVDTIDSEKNQPGEKKYKDSFHPICWLTSVDVALSTTVPEAPAGPATALATAPGAEPGPAPAAVSGP